MVSFYTLPPILIWKTFQVLFEDPRIKYSEEMLFPPAANEKAAKVLRKKSFCQEEDKRAIPNLSLPPMSPGTTPTLQAYDFALIMKNELRY